MKNLTLIYLTSFLNINLEVLAVPSGLFFVFLLLLIVGVVAAVYFTAQKYRKILAFERYDLGKKIEHERQRNEHLMNEIAQLHSELDRLENNLSCSQNENEQLKQIIRNLEEQIKRLTEDRKTDSNDIKIEYYMNKKSEG